MPKLLSYLKSLVPSEKAIRRLPHWQNLVPISPRDQYEIHTQVISKVGANSWDQNNTDLEYLQKMYDCHDLVYSCIDLVSSQFALGKMRVKKYDVKTEKYNYVPDHPLQLVLDNPNNSMSGYDLQQSYIVHRLLFGTMSAIMLRSSMASSDLEVNRCPKCKQLEPDEQCVHVLWHFHEGPVVQIIPVHLDRLGKEEVQTPRGRRTFFVYDFGNGVKTLVHPNNILTDPKYNSGGSFYGTSPTATIKRWLEIDLGLSTQIGAYLANNAIPSMILNLKPPKYMEGGARIDDPSALLKVMEEKWMKDFSLGSHMSGYNNKPKKPAFTFGDLEVLKIQDGIKDIVQKPLFYEITSRIARAYKVPPTFFEFGLDYGSQGSTAKQQNEDFYNRAIAPELRTFREKMTRYVLRSYNDPTLKLEWDLSDMGIASFLEEKKKTHTLKVWEMGLDTRDATREQLGMNPLGGELGDDLYRRDVLGNNEDDRSLNPANRGTEMVPRSTDNRVKPSPDSSDED